MKFLVGHAMYISTVVCAAELAEEKNVFLPIVELLELGHIPIGPERNYFLFFYKQKGGAGKLYAIIVLDYLRR